MEKATLFDAVIDLLVLTALRTGPEDANGIIAALEACAPSIPTRQAAIHPSLYRLEHRCMIEGEWRSGSTTARSTYYRLTEFGRARLRQETTAWRQFSGFIDHVLDESRHGRHTLARNGSGS